uniref:hypothetical protein n=1 Tax=Rhodohalobacter sp. 8-1 TaxID=3131972 RepID=UPI00403F5957
MMSKLVAGTVLAILGIVMCGSVVMGQNLNSVKGDRQALVDLYHATGGDGWDNNSGWLNGDPSNSWHGIEVDRNGRVVKVKLNGTGFGQKGKIGGNNLRGAIPSSIGNLSKVTYFNVKQNKLTGEIPSSIGNMTNLVDLLLNGRRHDPKAEVDHHPGKENGSGTQDRSNNFTGGIPAAIGKLTSLQQFELIGKNIDTKGLTEDIPKEIGNLTQLVGLHLSFNNLSGLPNSLQNLKQLEVLGLSHNKLNGGVPETAKELVNLRYFRIDDNKLGGTIPDLSLLTNLRLFSAVRAELKGKIPPALYDGTNPNINIITLSWNDLEGKLADFGQNNLIMFTVDGNNLTGTVPASIIKAKKLKNLGLGWNNFEGQLPSDLSMMHQLRYIRVTSNDFSGPLPALHTDNNKLSRLWFQDNNFSGPIDPSIAEAVMNGRDPFFEVNFSNNRFCAEDLKDLINDINGLNNVKKFRYDNQNEAICGNSSNSNEEQGPASQTTDSVEGDRQALADVYHATD